MFKFLSRASIVAGVAGFVRSPAGRKMIQDAKTWASKPENRRKAADLVNKARKPR